MFYKKYLIIFLTVYYVKQPWLVIIHSIPAKKNLHKYNLTAHLSACAKRKRSNFIKFRLTGSISFSGDPYREENFLL